MGSRDGVPVPLPGRGHYPAAFLAGAASVLAQITLLRELGVSAAAGEVTLGLCLAAWLLGGAMLAGWPEAGCRLQTVGCRKDVSPDRADSEGPADGSDGPTGPVRSVANPRGSLWAIAAAGFCLAAFAAARSLPWAAGCGPGVPPAAGWLAAAIVLVMGLPAGALGRLFPALCSSAGPGSAGRVYAAESAGFLAGGLAYPLLLDGAVGAVQFICLAAGLLAAAAGLLARTRAGGCAAAAALAAVAALALGPAAWRLDAHLLRLQWPAAAAVSAVLGRSGSAHLVRRGAGEAVYLDGLMAHALGEAAGPRIAAHLPLSMHPSPGRVLLVGGTLDGTLREALRQPVEQVVACEFEAGLTRRVAAKIAGVPPAGPRILWPEADPRAFLESESELFDVAILALPAPGGALLGRYSSIEFFRAVRGRMAPRGLVFVRMPVEGGFLDEDARALGGTLARTFLEVFPGAGLIPAEQLFLAATLDGPFRPPTAGAILDRLRQRRVDTDWLEPERVADWLAPESIVARLYWVPEAASPPGTGPAPPDGSVPGGGSLLRRWAALPGSALEQDLDAGGYRRALAARLAVWSPRSANVLRAAASVGCLPAALTAAVLTLGFGLLARRRREAVGRWSGVLVSTGFAVMAATVLLLIAHEVERGRLLGDLGVLCGIAMCGGSAGALAASSGRLSAGLLGRLVRVAELLAVITLALSAAALAPGAGARVSTFAVYVGLALLGFTGGFQFSAIARLLDLAPGGSVARQAGLCYALDLAGASIGALLAATLLLPAWGIAGGLGLLVAVKAASAAACPRQ